MAWIDVVAGEYGFTLAAALYAYAALAAPLAGVAFAAASFMASALWGLVYSIILLSYTMHYGPLALFGGSLIVDPFSALLLSAANVVFVLAAVGLWGIADKWEAGEAVYAAMALMGLGVLALAAAQNYQMIYAAWILAAITSYVLVALRKNGISVEAAVKYAATGAIATIVLLLGLTVAYHGYGLAFSQSAAAAGANAAWLLAAALAMIVSAAGFKIGVVPFQMWMPDVYGNAEPAVLSIVASIAKVVSLIILVKLLYPLTILEPHTYAWIVGLFALATMFYGNIGALLTVRDSPQKLLAYSSIAQAGYLVAALAALAQLPGAKPEVALAGIAIHGFAYALAKLTAFQALAAAGCRSGSCGWAAVRGLAKRNPMLGFSLAVAMASLAGIPVTLGFWGKLYMFLAVASISAGLAALMLVNFALAVFYYGYMIYQVALAQPEAEGEVKIEGNTDVAAVAAALLTILLGLVGWQFYNVTLSLYV